MPRSHWARVKPPSGVRIDRDNRFGQFLAAAWVMKGEGGMEINRVSRVPSTWNGTAASSQGAPSFDGTASYLNCGIDIQIGNVVRPSICARIYANTLTGSQRIIAASRQTSTNGWSFGFLNTALQYVTWGVTQYDAGLSTINTGKWYDVAVVHDIANNARFFLNGRLTDVTAGSGTAGVNTDDVWLIGCGAAPGSAPPNELFNGMIDYLYVFNNPIPDNGPASIAADPYQVFVQPRRPATRLRQLTYNMSAATQLIPNYV